MISLFKKKTKQRDVRKSPCKYPVARCQDPSIFINKFIYSASAMKSVSSNPLWLWETNPAYLSVLWPRFSDCMQRKRVGTGSQQNEPGVLRNRQESPRVSMRRVSCLREHKSDSTVLRRGRMCKKVQLRVPSGWRFAETSATERGQWRGSESCSLHCSDPLGDAVTWTAVHASGGHELETAHWAEMGVL